MHFNSLRPVPTFIKMLEGKIVEQPAALVLKFKYSPDIEFSVCTKIKIRCGLMSISFPARIDSIVALIDWLKDAKRYQMSLEKIRGKSESIGD